jgi:tryptophan synthase alpha chain
MTRIAACLEQLQQQGRTALVPYIIAGDPSPEFTVPMMHKLVEQGADIIELGVPFSDPMAEGPVIQLGHERALVHAISLRDVLGMVTEFRKLDQKTPVVLMGYANPVEYMGYQPFAEAASTAGVDGLLTVDIPPEEAGELDAELKKVGIDSIFLIAPTTTDERIKSIAEVASGYLYCVSVKGVTGSSSLDVNDVSERLKTIKSLAGLPVCVGFGIKNAETAAAIAEVAEGVIVGSALVKKAIDLAVAGHDLQQQIDHSSMLIGEMRQAMDAC